MMAEQRMPEQVLPHFHGHDHPHPRLPAGQRLAPTQDLHIRGVVLPAGEVRDLWIHDGQCVEGPLPHARTLVSECWVIPGLVDAHNHIDLPAGGTIVLVATVVFLLSWLLAPRHGLLGAWLRRRADSPVAAS